MPRHLAEVRQRREEQIDKTKAAVNERLTKEMSYWDNRAVELQAQEAAGKTNARLNSQIARQRAEELYARLTNRMAELERERQISPLPPVVIGGALVVPAVLLAKFKGETPDDPDRIEQFARETARVEHMAMQAVMESERQLGHEPRDVSAEKCGYDIKSPCGGYG